MAPMDIEPLDGAQLEANGSDPSGLLLNEHWASVTTPRPLKVVMGETDLLCLVCSADVQGYVDKYHLPVIERWSYLGDWGQLSLDMFIIFALLLPTDSYLLF